MLRGLLAFLHRLSYFLFLFHLVCDWDIMAIVLIRFVFLLAPRHPGAISRCFGEVCGMG